jgi:nucleotide-binding universal stress UspA family protein
MHVVAVHASMALVASDGQMLIDPNIMASLRADLTRRVREQCRDGNADTADDLEILNGQPAQVIIHVANVRMAPIIVVGLGRHQVVDRIFGNETALKVARASRVPVLAVPERITTTMRHAIVGVDFSEGSVRAAQNALEVLDEKGILELVHVVPRERLLLDGWVSQEEYSRFVRYSLTRFLGRLTVPNGVRVTDLTLSGDPARELVTYANRVGADLIAAGSHGHGFITRLVVGSVTTKLLRTSTCPVLIVPADSDHSDLRPSGASVTLEIRRSRWGELLDDFTRRNVGCRTRLEVDDPVVGAQPQETDYPLAGVTFDPVDGRVEIMLGQLGAGEPHLTRSIADVDSVNVLTNNQGQDVAVRFGQGAGQTILTVLR